MPNYERVKKTDAILLAEVISKTSDDVEFKVLEVVKGDFQGGTFHGEEQHTSCHEYSFDIQLASALPPLIAKKLPKIKPKYLLFLEKNQDGWQISEWAEEDFSSPIIDIDSSSLVNTVRQYTRISSFNNYEVEKKELRKLRALALSGKNENDYPKSLVADVDDQFISPTPGKSYKDLIKLYARLEDKKKRDVLWAFAWGKHKEASEFFMNLFRSPLPTNYIGPISKYIETTKDQVLLRKLGRNYPNLSKSGRWPLMWALINTADQSHMDLMLAALKSADEEEVGRLSTWFERYPNDEGTQIIKKLLGTNYSVNYELTFSLAGLGDIATIEWARNFMNSSDKDRWVAYYTIARSPLDEADKLAKSVIAGSNTEDLINLIQGYQKSRNPNRFNRLSDVIKLPNKDPKVTYWLKVTLDEMADDGSAEAKTLSKMVGS